eukprot:364705-Chlamydomonas_euryale.AAC.9
MYRPTSFVAVPRLHMLTQVRAYASSKASNALQEKLAKAAPKPGCLLAGCCVGISAAAWR